MAENTPVGLRPLRYALEQRDAEIAAAVGRYTVVAKRVPDEWIVEWGVNRLLQMIWEKTR